MIANTPDPPYYAVIFSSLLSEEISDYKEMAKKMIELSKQQEGFLGVESVRTELGITVSYWKSLEAIKKWKDNSEHSIARDLGKRIWYNSFKVRIAKVEHDYEFERE